jgi:hypothetical protein
MPIDPLSEETMPLAAAARKLPCLRNGRPIRVSTLWRWATRGVRGVRLDTAYVGSVRVTTEASLREFFERLRRPERAAPDAVRPEGRRRQAECDRRVDRQLDELGL